MKSLSFLPLLLLLTACPAERDLAPAAPGPATYRVTFEATWSAATHPQAYPYGAHFSPLMGLSHSDGARLFAAGTLASPGIRLMAERGSNATLRTELQALQRLGTGFGLLDNPVVFNSPGRVADTIRVDGQHPLVSAVTMIAPSPDWFVALEGQSLLDERGQWQPHLSVPARAYDAGTDSGPDFTSPDQATAPAQPVAAIGSAPLAPGGAAVPLGTFHLERIR
jgi:Spondin_N